MREKKILVFLLCLNFVCCASPQKQLEKARENDPKYQYNLGLLYMNNNNLDDAIKYFKKTLSLDSSYYLALNALGLAYSIKGELQEAVNYYNKCLEVNPSFSEARNNLGTVYQELGYLDKAEEEFKRVVADQTYASKELAYFNLGRLYYLRNEFDKALYFAENAIMTNNRFAMAFNLKGLVLEKQEKIQEALIFFEKAVKIVPEDVNFNFNLGAAYFKDNQFARAKEIFEKIAPLVIDKQMRESLDSYMRVIREKEGEET